MKLSLITEHYIKATQQGPAAAGDFARALSDADAELVAIGFKKLVRPLWYQRMRPFA